VRRAALLATGLLAITIVLTGCAGSGTPVAAPKASPYSSTVASELQAGVLSVTSSAAGGDPTAALARLDELTAALANARARGAVTTARFDSITASIALVRADLEAAVTAQNDQKPGRTDKPGKGNHGKDG
jgi:hypothetical protein